MKNFKTKFLGLALAGLILGACSQTGTYETADLMNEQAVANKAGFTMTPFSSGGGENFKVSDTETVYTNETFNVAVTAYNDCENTYFTITRIEGNMTVRVKQPGVASTQTNGPTILDGGTTVTTTVPHSEDWEDGDDVTISYYVSGLGGGSNNNFQSGIITYNLVDVCSGCDDEFSAVTTCSEDGSMRTATFTFTAGDDATYKIQGGLTAKSHNVDVNGATVIKVTKNNNNIISWTGALEECDVHTITVSWHSTNSDDEITGDWTVEKDGVKILVIDELGCDDEGEGYAPEVI